jgi:hypothetical protein
METLVEFAAGAVIVFAGLWWLEGHGPGLRPPPSEPVSVRSENDKMIDPSVVRRP